MSPKKLYIIRGVSGSGKTTLAKSIWCDLVNCRHFEADMFFIKDDGSYVYEPDRIKDAHQWCQLAVEQAMRSSARVGSIIVSNTFTRKWEYEHYLRLADRYGFDVEIIVCRGEYQNTHGVPDHIVQAMRDRFEE